MFAGIVEETAFIAEIEEVKQGKILEVVSSLDHTLTSIGDSIAIDGVCLTVVQLSQLDGMWRVSFDVASETLRCTTLGDLRKESPVHIERSLFVGDRLHGHFVSGHVDTTAELVAKVEEGETVKLTFSLDTAALDSAALDPSVMEYIVPKGSLAISGTSLTIGEVEKNSFSVYIIPHTSLVTKLGKLTVGESVNIEYDMFARYVVNFLKSSQLKTATK